MKKNRYSSTCSLNKWKKGFLVMKLSVLILFSGILRTSANVEYTTDHDPVPRKLASETGVRTGISWLPEKSTSLPEIKNLQPRKELSGNVMDVDGNPIIGANVYVKNTTIGTITDVRGNFTLLVPNDAEFLVFSFIGMVTREVPVGNTVIFSVIMENATLEMEEVVVVGYGEQKKASVVGAISTATGEQLKRMNVSEVSNSLTGSIPGLITIQQTSIPGGGDVNTLMAGSAGDTDQRTKIYIRGQSTWSGGEPLILVDGIERRMEELDPNEINSISVLKDASATAVFGVRGANGVILITTKRGITGKPKLTFEGQHTTSVVSKIPKISNSYEANLLKNYTIVHEMAASPSSWDHYLPQEILNYYKTQEYPEIFPDVNWPSEMLKNAATGYKFNTNVSGGTQFVKYFGSLGYLHEGGIMKGDDLGQGYKANYDYDRFNFRSNLDFQFTRSTKVSLNLSGNYGMTKNPGKGDAPQQRMRGIYGMPPDLYPVRYSDGYYGNFEGFDYKNPYVLMNLNGIDRINQGQIFTDVSIEQKLDVITKGLSARAVGSYDNTLTERGRTIGGVSQAFKWIDPLIIYAAPEDSAAFIYYTIPTSRHGYEFYPNPTSYYSGSYHSLSRRLFYQFSLNYNRDFGKHGVSALALMNRRESALGSSFVSKREDWVGRITYNYDSRYFLEVNAGYNGSEKFDRQYRFGLFPSIGGGWMISNESFFKEALPWWSTLKVRYSQGKVGSDDGIERWLYVGSWRRTNARYVFGQPLTPAGNGVTFEGAVPNPDIQWETAVKKDIGIETGFFNNQLKFSFDYFTDNRYNMLIPASKRTTPITIGADLPAGNIGKTETKGYELDMEYRKYFNFGIGLSSRFSVGYVKDKIIYKDDPDLKPDYQKQAGFPINQTRSYFEYGIIQNWDELYTSTLGTANTNVLPGEFMFIDFNVDGIINDLDIVPHGYPSRPQYNYSYNFSINYKGLTLYALLYGVFNVNVSQHQYSTFRNNYSIVYSFDLTDRFMPELGNTVDARNAAPKLYRIAETRFGRYVLIDGSYLRLKNAEISYQIPDKYIQKAGLTNLRFYFTGYNLFQWTKEEWKEDREAAQRDWNTEAYPLMKRYTFGLTIGL